MLRRHNAGAFQEIAGAGVVAKPGPFRHHIFIGSGGKVSHGWPAVQKSLEAGGDGGDGGLLQHDLA